MVASALVNADIEAGKKAVEALDAEGVAVRLAMWWLDLDAGEWRLVLGMPVIDKKDANAAYKAVQTAFRKHKILLPLRRVAVVGMDSQITQSLRRFVKTGPRSTSDIQVGTSVVDGFPIAAAHVYRST